MSGVDMMMVTGAILFGAFVFWKTSGGKAGSNSLLPGSNPTLADVLELIDSTANRRASESVSEDITTHRAAKRKAELLEALAPKGQADGQ